MLMGAYFTQEYALESAALFNPSMVWHPDQSGLPEGSRQVYPQPAGNRRGTHLVDHVPERHDRRPEPAYASTSRPGSSPRPSSCPTPLYDKNLFSRKLIELGIDSPFASAGLGDRSATSSRSTR